METPETAAAPRQETPHTTIGSFARGNTVAAAHHPSADDFGARLDSSFGASSDQAAQSGLNWMLIAACGAVLIVAIGGGLFFRSRTAVSRTAGTNPAAVTQQAPQSALQAAPASTSSVPASSLAAQQPSAIPSSASPLSATNAAPAISSANPVGAAKPVASAPQQAITEAKPTAPKVTPGMMSQSLSAHPTSTQRAGAAGAEAAPALDVPAESEGVGAALSGISSGSHVPNLAPPTVQPEQPVRIGGDVKEPRLISSILPIYPIGARQAGVEGDVIVSTTIDKNGSVVKMHVVSGPVMLRQAALDALRRWKYEPSMLNGQPLAVEMQVTIKFRR